MKQKRKSLVDQYSSKKKASKVLWSNRTHKGMPRPFRLVTPQNSLSVKNRYYDRKVRESLEIDMAVVKYGQDKVLKRDNGNFVKTNAWKPLFKKMKALH